VLVWVVSPSGTPPDLTSTAMQSGCRLVFSDPALPSLHPDCGGSRTSPASRERVDQTIELFLGVVVVD